MQAPHLIAVEHEDRPTIKSARAFHLRLIALIVLFGMWLTSALLNVHRDPEKAEAIIRATGE